MVTDLLSLEAYFATYNGQYGIADYVFGSTDDILNRKSKNIAYPCLWLELMDERFNEDGYSFFNIRLTLQAGTGNTARVEDRVTMNNLRDTLRKIIAKMQLDSPAKIVYVHPKCSFYFKEKYANDDELLAMVETEIGAIKTC